MPGINELENADWIKAFTFDHPDIETGEQLAKYLQEKTPPTTPEEYLQLPAAQADHPAIRELRQMVWEKHGGQGEAPHPPPRNPDPFA